MSKSPYLIPDLLLAAAERGPDSVALRARKEQIDYGTLTALVHRFAAGLCQLGLQKQDRVAIYLNKRPETVVACFGTSQAGGVFVPVNPLLKAPQVGHILRDSGATVMITTADRLADLESELTTSPTLRHLVIVGNESGPNGARRGNRLLQLGSNCSIRGRYTTAPRHRPGHRVDSLYIGQHGSTQGRRTLAPEHGDGGSQRCRVPGKFAG